MSSPPPDWLVTSDSHASPADHHPRDPRGVRWYLPTWGERLRLMGWRNVLWLLPIAVVVALSIVIWFGLPLWAFFGWWKVAAVIVGVPISIATKQTRAALKDRNDPFCIHCGYSLTGLADGQPCPECGETTTHAICREYQRDPHAFIDRFNSHGSMPVADAPFEIRRDAPLRGDGT